MKEDITQKILSIYGNFELSEVERLNELEILYMKQEEEIERQKEVINELLTRIAKLEYEVEKNNV